MPPAPIRQARSEPPEGRWQLRPSCRRCLCRPREGAGSTPPTGCGRSSTPGGPRTPPPAPGRRRGEGAARAAPALRRSSFGELRTDLALHVTPLEGVPPLGRVLLTVPTEEDHRQ